MRTSEGTAAPSKVLVVGLGTSGQAVCELLLKRGTRVVATDLRPRMEFGDTLNALEDRGCILRLGGHEPDDFLNVDQIIVSPGVPLGLEPLVQATQRGIEVVGELEWAWRQVAVPVVAVTGTNGKTTTTSLIGEMLRVAGRRVFVGGNIGTPLSRWLLEPYPVDALVLEVSSFQLDGAPSFNPDVAVLLNVTEDHLDRYDSFADYVNCKFSIFARQGPHHTAIINADDPICWSGICRVPGRTLTFSRVLRSGQAFVDDAEVVVRVPGLDPFRLHLHSVPLRGNHNQENLLASVLAGAVMGAAPGAIQEAINHYRGLPHRMEWVGSWRGIDFYDDSKGTNVGAVVKAVESFDRPVLILLGGRDKLGSYRPLAECLKRRGKAAFVFGEAAPRLQDELKNWLPTQACDALPAAFEGALELAVSGDVVLLSPACSSFDQYQSYAQRGDHFKELVRRLINPGPRDH